MSQPISAIAAATFMAAGFLTVSAPVAQADPGDCVDWEFSGPTTINVTGDFVPPDPDGFNISFTGSGKTASGPAKASSLPLVNTADGTISGGINGASLSLTWTQTGGNGLVIQLQQGAIGFDDIARGTAGGQFAGGLWSSTPLTCKVRNKPAEAPAAEPQGPPAGPTLAPRNVPGGLVITVTDHSGKTSKCHYDSEVFKRDFTLNANSSTDLTFVPALALDRDWPVTVTCDNGATTQQTIHF